MELDIKLLKECYNDFNARKVIYENMYQYYIGNSAVVAKYSAMEYQESHKMNFNFIKKLIKEEISYSVGSNVNYVCKTNENIAKEIEYNLYHWDKKHDSELLKNMLIYSTAFELYYLKDKQFNSRLISPRNGYACVDDLGNVLFFMYIYQLKFSKDIHINLYTENEIIYFDKDFNETKARDIHYWGSVPVSIGITSEELENDTLYSDIKDIQDGYSIIASDGVNEITNTRQAILKAKGMDLNAETTKALKQFRGASLPKDGDLDWLIKNLNPEYQRLMMETLEDKIYQLSMHINQQERMQSNNSSLALRTRLLNLEMKVSINNKALTNILLSRIKFLFIYLNQNIGANKPSYDWRDVSIKFNSVIPSDDLMMANIISQLGDNLSNRTGLQQLSFIDNADIEREQRKKEQEEEMINLENIEEETPPSKDKDVPNE